MTIMWQQCGIDTLHIVLKLIKKIFIKKISILNVKCQMILKSLIILTKMMTFYKFVKCLKCQIVKKVNKDVKLIGRARVNGFGKTFFVSFGTICS